MSITNTWTTYQPFGAFAFAVRLTSCLKARRQGICLARTIGQLRKLDPHILRDIGVDQGALYELKPKIIDSDGHIVFP